MSMANFGYPTDVRRGAVRAVNKVRKGKNKKLSATFKTPKSYHREEDHETIRKQAILKLQARQRAWYKGYLKRIKEGYYGQI